LRKEIEALLAVPSDNAAEQSVAEKARKPEVSSVPS
jgi:hypothetical protein